MLLVFLRAFFSFPSRGPEKGIKREGRMPFREYGPRCVYSYPLNKSGIRRVLLDRQDVPVTAPLGRADASFSASVLVDGAGGSARLGKCCFEDAGYAAKRPAIKQKRMTLDCVVALRQSRVMDGTWALPSVITSVFY